jgi:hypothetical protein
MGPLLLSRLLSLNDTQSGVLNLVFKIADDNGYLLLDLKDLRSMVQFVGENADQFRVQYGNVSTASIGAIQRNLIALEEQGGAEFFGEPALSIDDLIQTDQNGKGVINILSAEKLFHSPKVYATFLLWMLAELFDNCRKYDPRTSDILLLKPIVLKMLGIEMIEQVRLIRSSWQVSICHPESAGPAGHCPGAA